MNLRTLTPDRQHASAVRRARFCLGLLLVLGVAGPAWAGDVTVNVKETRGAYSVRGELVTPVAPAIVWSVLTDYDHIDTFVRAMRTSRSVRRPDGHLIVHQDATVGLLLMRRLIQVALDVREDAQHRIVFEDRLGRDFESYSGEWELHADPAGVTRVSYQLEAVPRRNVPFVARNIMGRDVRDLLSQVGAEMARRAAVQRAGPAAAAAALDSFEPAAP